MAKYMLYAFASVISVILLGYLALFAIVPAAFLFLLFTAAPNLEEEE